MHSNFIVYFLCALFVVYLIFSFCVCVSVCTCVCFRINHVEDHVENQRSGLDPDNLRSVHGKKLFENSQYLVQTYTQLTIVADISLMCNPLIY